MASLAAPSLSQRTGIGFEVGIGGKGRSNRCSDPECGVVDPDLGPGLSISRLIKRSLKLPPRNGGFGAPREQQTRQMSWRLFCRRNPLDPRSSGLFSMSLPPPGQNSARLFPLYVIAANNDRRQQEPFLNPQYSQLKPNNGLLSPARRYFEY